jgi:hypothetical protein
VTDRFDPKASRYFARLDPERPIFQGDIFRGGFGAFWRHPEAVRSALAGSTPPASPPFPGLDELRSLVVTLDAQEARDLARLLLEVD